MASSPTQKIPKPNTTKTVKSHRAHGGEKSQSKNKPTWKKIIPLVEGKAPEHAEPKTAGVPKGTSDRKAVTCRTCKKPITITPHLQTLLDSGRKQLACGPCQDIWKATQAVVDTEKGIHLCDHEECPQGAACVRTTHYHRIPNPKTGAAKRIEEAKPREEKKAPRPVRALLCGKKISECADAACHHHKVKNGPKKQVTPVFEEVDLDTCSEEDYLGVSIVKGKPIHTFTPKIVPKEDGKRSVSSAPAVVAAKNSVSGGGVKAQTTEDLGCAPAIPKSPAAIGVPSDIPEKGAPETVDEGGGTETRTLETADAEPTGEATQIESKIDTSLYSSDEEPYSSSDEEEEEEKEKATVTIEEAATIVAALEADAEVPPPPPRPTQLQLLSMVRGILKPEMRDHAAFITVVLESEEDPTYDNWEDSPSTLRAACARALHEQRRTGKSRIAADELLFRSYDIYGNEISMDEPVRSIGPRGWASSLRVTASRESSRGAEEPQPPSVNLSRDTSAKSGEGKTLPDIEDSQKSLVSTSSLAVSNRLATKFPPSRSFANLGHLGLVPLDFPPVAKFHTRKVNLYFATGGVDMRSAITKWLTAAVTSLPYVNAYKVLPIEEGEPVTLTRSNTTFVQAAYNEGLYFGWKETGVPQAATVREKTDTMLQYLNAFNYKTTRLCPIFTELYTQLSELPGVFSINVLSLTSRAPTNTAMAAISNVCNQYAGSKAFRNASSDTYDWTVMYLYQQKLLTEAKMLDAMPPVTSRPANVVSGPQPR